MFSVRYSQFGKRVYVSCFLTQKIRSKGRGFWRVGGVGKCFDFVSEGFPSNSYLVSITFFGQLSPINPRCCSCRWNFINSTVSGVI